MFTTQIISQIVDNVIVDLRPRMPRTLMALADRGRIQTSAIIDDWDVMFPTTNGSLITTINTVATNTTGSEVIKATQSGLGEYKVAERFSIQRSHIVQARERAPGFLQNLYQSVLQDRILKLATSVNRLLWTGQGDVASGMMVGIPRLLDNTFNYAGINRTTYTRWRCPQLTNGTARALTRALVLNYQTLLLTEMVGFNYVTAHPLILERYSSVFDTIAGNMQLTASPNGNNAYSAIDLGYGDRFFMGYPMVGEPEAPSDAIFTMDTSNITLHCMDLAVNPTATGSLNRSDSEEYNYISSANAFGMPINIARLPSQVPNVVEFELSVHPIIQYRNPREVQAIRNLLNA